MSEGFARNGWPRGVEYLTPANWVASATPHVKGSWVEIDSSVATDLVGLAITNDNGIGVVATDSSMLVDIGIGAAAAEVAVVSNIPVGGHAISQIKFYLPIHIPAGVRLAGRIQGAITVDIFDPEIFEYQGHRPGSWGGYSIADTIGVDTATSGPATGDLADNAWDEAIASTAEAYRALTFHPCFPPGDTDVQTAGVLTVDIGMGAGGSEQVLGTYRLALSSNEIITVLTGPPFIEADIPAGSRLAIRKNSTADLSGALIAWR